MSRHKITIRERHFAGASDNEQDRPGRHDLRDRGGVARRHGVLAELADRIGLTATADVLRARHAGHGPGRVLADVAVMIVDGEVTITDCAG